MSSRTTLRIAHNPAKQKRTRLGVAAVCSAAASRVRQEYDYTRSVYKDQTAQARLELFRKHNEVRDGRISRAMVVLSDDPITPATDLNLARQRRAGTSRLQRAIAEATVERAHRSHGAAIPEKHRVLPPCKHKVRAVKPIERPRILAGSANAGSGAHARLAEAKTGVSRTRNEPLITHQGDVYTQHDGNRLGRILAQTGRSEMTIANRANDYHTEISWRLSLRP